MAHHPGDMGRNLSRRRNSLGQFAPSFPNPAINSARVSRVILHDNNEMVPAAVALPSNSYLFGGTVPPAHWQNPFQQRGGAGRIHTGGQLPPPLHQHGNELTALMAALNNSSSRPFQPNGHVLVWYLGQPYGPQTQQQPIGAVAPLHPGPERVGPSDRGVRALLPMPPPGRGRGAVAPPARSNAGAPPAVVNRYDATSWAPRAAMPALYLPGGRSSARTGVLAKPTKSFEEYLRDQGIPVPIVADELPVLDDTANECAAMVAELLGDPAENPGRAESADLVISAGGHGVLLPPAVGSCSGGPTLDQLGLETVRVPGPSLAAGDVGGRRGYGRTATAAAAREQRSKKMAEKKVAAAAKARAQKLAAARGSQEGT